MLTMYIYVHICIYLYIENALEHLDLVNGHDEFRDVHSVGEDSEIPDATAGPG